MILILSACASRVDNVNQGKVHDVRGECVRIPAKEDMSRFIDFLDNELASRGVNVLVLRIDYNLESA